MIAIPLLLASCATSSSSSQPETVVIGSLGTGDGASETGITREELEDHVRRFADRYMTRVALATNMIRNQSDDAELINLMQSWKSVSYASVVDIAIGPNAVTNMMDMMALTRLSRLVVASYWSPEILGPEFGPDFLQTFVDLEDDIWTISEDVLTSSQRQTMKELVNDWHAENPEQIYPWYVRLSNFSGQRAASLAAVQQTGGMLKEVARAREAAEEIQAFGERVLFYLQRAPMITSAQFSSSTNDVLGGPHISQAMDDMGRFVAAVERLVATVDELPGSRLAAVDQFMERMSQEREAVIRDLASSESELVDLLAALQPALESVERTVVAAKIHNPDSPPFDINEYRALVVESAATAAELRKLADAVDRVMQNSERLTTLVDAIVEAENAVVDRIFLQAIILILIFFVLLTIYRLVIRRIVPT